MNPIVDFKALPERIRSAGKRVIVAVASPADSHTEEVIERSISENFAQFTLVAVEGKQTIACQKEFQPDVPFRTGSLERGCCSTDGFVDIKTPHVHHPFFDIQFV